MTLNYRLSTHGKLWDEYCRECDIVDTTPDEGARN